MTITDRPRAAIYARYSSDMQNPKSVDDQVRECRQYASRQGWDVVDVFSDAEKTGSLRDRQEYQALLAAVRERNFDVVVFEHIDRLGRDLEHLMGFYKAATHADTDLYQISRGKLGILDIGVLGTFATIFLEELGFKTRRGLVGKFEEGKSAGGISYGYRVAGSETGQPIKGKVEIALHEAEVVQRIFREYAEGKAPQKIASDLNADGIPSPCVGTKRRSTGKWKQTTINGSPERGTGILNNELYVGRRLWGKLKYSKDPSTGRRISRPVPRDQWLEDSAPELRIIEDDLWTAVKNRQASLRKTRSRVGGKNPDKKSAIHGNRRRKYLMSGLMTCGQCGGNLTIAGSGEKKRYYCSRAKEMGPSVCSGMPGLPESAAGLSILSGLRYGLMQDGPYEEFKRKFEAHYREGHADRAVAARKYRDRVRELETQRENLLNAIRTGVHSPSIIQDLNDTDEALEAARTEMERNAPKPLTLPDDLPAIYRAHVNDLLATLSEGEITERAGDALHELVDDVVVSWEAEERVHHLDIRGNLLEMLKTATPAERAGVDEAKSSLKLVAGVGFEPTTFRL